MAANMLVVVPAPSMGTNLDISSLISTWKRGYPKVYRGRQMQGGEMGSRRAQKESKICRNLTGKVTRTGGANPKRRVDVECDCPFASVYLNRPRVAVGLAELSGHQVWVGRYGTPLDRGNEPRD
jgi:hypothetical protein